MKRNSKPEGRSFYSVSRNEDGADGRPHIDPKVEQMKRGGKHASQGATPDSDSRAGTGSAGNNPLPNADTSSQDPKNSTLAGGTVLRAAAGDDQVMSSMPLAASGASGPASGWSERSEAAHLKWDKLSISELHGLDGSQKALANLLRDRYSLDGGDAERQVSAFFHSSRSAPTT